MNLISYLTSRLTAEWRLQRLGRRSLREVQFRKYKIADEIGGRVIAERLLRKLPGQIRHGNSLKEDGYA